MKHGLMLMLAVLIPSRSIAEDPGRGMPARADPIAAAQTATMRDEPGQSFRDCADCPEMVVVPAGSFMMGSPDDEPGGFFDGNVLQWVQDCLSPSYAGLPTDGSAYETGVDLKMTGRLSRMTGTGSCSYRMVRGADWNVLLRWFALRSGILVRAQERRFRIIGARVWVSELQERLSSFSS